MAETKRARAIGLNHVALEVGDIGGVSDTIQLSVSTDEVSKLPEATEPD
jgi:hypothetical protein